MRRRNLIVISPLVITVQFKGLDVLQAHIPESRAPGALWQVPLRIAVVFALTTLFFVPVMFSLLRRQLPNATEIP